MEDGIQLLLGQLCDAPAQQAAACPSGFASEAQDGVSGFFAQSEAKCLQIADQRRYSRDEAGALGIEQHPKGSREWQAEDLGITTSQGEVLQMMSDKVRLPLQLIRR